MSLYEHGIRLAWIVTLGYWAWSALRVKRVASQESWSIRFIEYFLPLIVSAWLIGPGEWFGHSWLREQILPHTEPVYAIGMAIGIAGAVLCIWARTILGRNWSVSVQLKQEHELIQSGPYRWIRHPIYTGFLLLFLGSAIMVGDVRGPLAVALVFVSFWHKLRKEERWLGELFGPAYRDYRTRTKALIPGVI